MGKSILVRDVIRNTHTGFNNLTTVQLLYCMHYAYASDYMSMNGDEKARERVIE